MMSLISEAINKDKLKEKKTDAEEQELHIKDNRKWKEFSQTKDVIEPVTKSHVNEIKSY